MTSQPNPNAKEFIPPRLNGFRHVLEVLLMIVTGGFVFVTPVDSLLGYLPSGFHFLVKSPLLVPACTLFFWTAFYHVFTLLLNESVSQRRVYPGTEYTVSQYTVALFHQVILLPLLLHEALTVFSHTADLKVHSSLLESELAQKSELQLPFLHRWFEPLWWICGWDLSGYPFYFEKQIWWALIGYQLKDFIYSKLDIFFTLHHIFAIVGSVLCLVSPLGVGLLTFNCVNAEFGSSTFNMSELLPKGRFIFDPLYLFMMTISNIIVVNVAYEYWQLPLPLVYRGAYIFISGFLVLLRQAGVVQKVISMLRSERPKIQ